MNPREIDRDEDLFFRIIQTMPSEIEAVDLLRRAREWVLNEKDEASNKKEKNELDRLLTRLNDEIKYQNQRINRINERAAVKELFGADALTELSDFMHAKRMESMGCAR